MKKRKLQLNSTLRSILLVLLLSVAGMTKGFAQNYDFSAVCETGQTLYYNIIDATNHYVELTFPGDDDLPYSYWHGEEIHDYPRPTGNITLPSSVTYNGVTYTVTSIHPRAFSGCSGLTGSLTIPNSVTEIGEAAFSGCSGFTGSLTIGNSVTEIDVVAFYGCSGFTGSLTIPNSVTSIGAGAFYGCSGFTGSLTIGNSVTEIDVEAFYGCSGFTGTLTIPNSVTSIGGYAFSSCSGIAQVNYNATNCHGGDEGRFHSCTGTLTIGDNVEQIPEYMFSGAGFTGSLTIPSSVASIGMHAFYCCVGFTSISIPGSVVYIGKEVFHGTGWYNDQPNGIVYLNDCCLGYKGSKPTGSLNFLEGTRIIAGEAFADCSGLTGSLTIPNSVTSIGGGAFSGCSGFMGSLTIPNSVTTIGPYAFYDCSGFTSMSVLSETPPMIYFPFDYYGSPFAGWPCSIPVYVPCGSVSLYQLAQYWSEFTNYQGIDCVEYNITASANPVEGGAVAGDGTYYQGQTCTLSATPNANYIFLNWTENGEAVSSNPVYSFTVADDRDLVANFVSAQVTVNVSANPEIGGNVVGGGTYSYGTAVTLTATANPDYVFVHWTENGEVVSTNPTYSFTATADRNLVALFDALTNYWEPESNAFEDNMTLTCIVQLDGVEQATSMLEVGAFCGTQCRGSQRATYFAPSDHYIIQMIVFGESNDMISFRLYDHLTEQELMLTPPTPITFNSNGYGSLFNPYVLNFTSNVLISAEASPAGAGTITGVGEYPIGTEVTLTAVANSGYQFVNWMLEGVVVSTSPSYQFTVTEAADFVANFGCVHTQALNSGWNWWSTYIELTDNNGLSQLENSLGNAGILIKSRTNGYVEAYQYNGATNWYGTLTSINNEQMYKVRTNANCNAIISGSFALPESHPITINSGWNWIGFPCNQNVSVDVAMSNFTPENNDVIKGRTGFTTYYSDNNYNVWYGTLNTLEVGKGYMYRSNSTTQKTLVFQTGRDETTMENVTTENNIFQPADGDFADNMTITVVLELDGEELRSDDYELAAFVGDECRGSVRLIFVEPVNRYVAFLTVFGEPSETLYFRLTDGTQTELSMEEIAFEADGMVGSLAEPKILCFGTTRVDENGLSKVLVYPNPSNGVFNIQGQGIRKIEVFNAFGQAVVSEETCNDHLQIDLSRYADGCYMLRVVTDNGISNRQLIKR